MSGGTSEIDRDRVEFFRRTRRGTIALYLFLTLAAGGLLVGGIANGATHALLAFFAAMVLSIALFGVSVLIPTSAKAARTLVWLVPVAGVVLTSRLDLDPFGNGSSPVVLGAGAGFLIGAVIGIALIRRRLAHDDDLLRRQRRLGFDSKTALGVAPE